MEQKEEEKREEDERYASPLEVVLRVGFYRESDTDESIKVKKMNEND
jgi:hypothetical protein